MLVPIVRKRVEYYTEWKDVVEFLKQQKFDLVVNHESSTVDIRLPTVIDDYTHHVAHINRVDIEASDYQWLKVLVGDNRHIEFIAKYQNSIVWKEDYKDCVYGSAGNVN